MKPLLDAVKDPKTGLMQFNDFVRLIEQLMRTNADLDRHIDKQVGGCMVNSGTKSPSGWVIEW